MQNCPDKNPALLNKKVKETIIQKMLAFKNWKAFSNEENRKIHTT